MNKLRTFLLAGALGLFALPAYSAMNTVQNPDGTASFVGRSGINTTGNCVGGVTLHFPFDATAHLISKFAPVGITDAKITDVWGLLDRTMTGRMIVQVYATNVSHNSAGNATTTASPVRFRNTVTNQASGARLQLDGETVGLNGPTVRTISTITQAGGANVIMENNLLGHPNHRVIVGNSEGVGSTNVSAIVFVRVCPR